MGRRSTLSSNSSAPKVAPKSTEGQQTNRAHFARVLAQLAKGDVLMVRDEPRCRLAVHQSFKQHRHRCNPSVHW
jgi:hypothetical protein